MSTTIVEVNATESGGHARDGLFDDIVFDDKESSATAVQKALAAKQVVAVRRKGKQLWLQLDRPPHLLAHFGMTGAFVVKGIEAASYKEFKVHDEEWPPRFTKLELVFSDGARLAFCDPRRLGRLRCGRTRSIRIHGTPSRQTRSWSQSASRRPRPSLRRPQSLSRRYSSTSRPS